MIIRRAGPRNRRGQVSQTWLQNRRVSSLRRRLILEPLEQRVLLSAAPVSIDLQPGSDSGIHDDDNLTNVRTPIIDITAVEAGDTISVYRDGVLLREATQIAGTLYQYTFQSEELAEGENLITARGFDGLEESEDSPPLVITLDTTPPRVISFTPAPQSTVDQTPSAIVASLDEPIDPSTVTASTFRLLGSGGDGTFADGNEIELVATSGSRQVAQFRIAGKCGL